MVIAVMSVADQSVPLTNLPRRVPFTVRFSPQFVNRMWDRLHKSAPVRAYVAGLLFGRSELDLIEVQVFRSLPDGEGAVPLPPDAAMVEALLESSRKDPEVAVLQLLGWYAFRLTGGLHESDVAFHNLHFRLPNEIALIIRPEQHPNVLLEIYSKSGTAALSQEDHRWGSLRLATNTNVAGPLDVAMRAKIGDDFYLRAYEVSKTLDRAERREYWANTVAAARNTIRSVLPKKRGPKPAWDSSLLKLDSQAATKTQLNSAIESPASAAPVARAAAAGAADFTFSGLPALQRATHLDAGIASPASVRQASSRPASDKSREEHALASIREAYSLQTIRAGDPPPVPAVIRRPRRGMPWLSSIGIAALAAAATFAVYYESQYANGGQMPAFLRAIFPDTGLGLRIEGQGDRVLLSWNRRNAVVRSSQGGVLHIDDGAQHRDVNLDSAQIANGAVLYRPASDDVAFRLEVHGQGGTAVVDTMRVLDGGKAAATEVKSAPTEVSSSSSVNGSTPSKPTAVVSRSDLRASRSSPGSASAPSASPLVPQGERSNSGVAPPSQLPSVPANVDATSGPVSEPPGTLPSPSTTPPGDLAQTQSPAAAAPAPSETRPPVPASSAAGETLKPSTPTASPEASQQTDASKSVSSGDGLAGRIAEPAQPTPGNAPLTNAQSGQLTNFIPPKPKKQVLPDLRFFSINSIVAVSQVEVSVKVDKRGRVSEANVVSNGSHNSPNLAQAAIAAARQWIFEPATLGGKKIASEHTIVFEFRPATR